MNEPCQHCDDGPVVEQWKIYWGKKIHTGRKCLACGNLISDVCYEEELRSFPDDLDIGDMTLLDFIHAETHLQELRSVINKLPVKTFMSLPRRWHEIFTVGMDDIKEWQIIYKLQGKEK